MREKITHHIVGLSGGKDSTALAIALNEREPRRYTYICTPTGDELPGMRQHWQRLECLLQAPIVRLQYPGGLRALIERYNALPSWRQRWCTRQLKIEMTETYLGGLDGLRVHYVGLRADEEGREGGDYKNAEIRFPLREWGWTESDVWTYLREKQVDIPPRTDCARCFFQTLGQWWALWRDHPEIYADAERQEKASGHTFRSPGRDTWPASLEMLRKEFEKGRIPRNAPVQDDLFGFEANQCRACSL